ncbi:hypothetical protein T4D_1329 [Trichinella pseudospiralis]|uniref:Uncharacterized protein n=1 Tax=Trichinella pseudospiralis TaxID=6337 RepID=A0A0V1DT29_TRIPS|nr:hypothetical protein T4D_1329 [Trichinella pseudospiralis]
MHAIVNSENVSQRYHSPPLKTGFSALEGTSLLKINSNLCHDII